VNVILLPALFQYNQKLPYRLMLIPSSKLQELGPSGAFALHAIERAVRLGGFEYGTIRQQIQDADGV
jgi:hypothetical protein